MWPHFLQGQVRCCVSLLFVGVPPLVLPLHCPLTLLYCLLYKNEFRHPPSAVCCTACCAAGTSTCAAAAIGTGACARTTVTAVVLPPHLPDCLFYCLRYHLFYQHLRSSCQWYWGLCWDHLVSDDLVSWKHLPPAVIPTRGWFDADGCFSGGLRMLLSGQGCAARQLHMNV